MNWDSASNQLTTAIKVEKELRLAYSKENNSLVAIFNFHKVQYFSVALYGCYFNTNYAVFPLYIKLWHWLLQIDMQLILKYAEETDSLKPPHRFVPWVTVNDQALEEVGP